MRRAFRPRTPDGAGNRIERALERLGSPADVLGRHGYRVRRRHAWCPLHDDKHPSLSLYRGRDGRERWHCHACDVGGDALDLEVELSGRSLGEVIRDA
jgi:hypothetical protein